MLLTIKQAALEMGVSAQTMRRWEKEGKITSRRTLGGHRRYDLSNMKEKALENITTKENFKSLNNIEYFISKYCFPLKLTNQGKEILNTIETHNHIILHQKQEVDVTTLMSAYIAYLAISTPEIKIGIFSHSSEFSKTILKNVVQYINTFSNDFKKTKITRKSIDNIEVNNFTRIWAQLANENGICGLSCDVVFVDNADFIINDYEFWTSIRGSMSIGGKIIMNSVINYNRSKSVFQHILDNTTSNNFYRLDLVNDNQYFT